MFIRNIVLGLAALGAGAMVSSMAFAQTSEDCMAGIEEVEDAINSMTESQQPGNQAGLDNARSMVEEAQNANDDGDNARCMKLVTDAQNVLEGLK